MVVGIIGYGTVGQAVASYYNKPIIYDPPKGIKGDLTKADYIFICVPTPESYWGFDLTQVKDAIKKAPKGKVLILKSTVLPGTTRILKKAFNVDLHFNPEFLSEHNSKEYFEEPQLQVVGSDSAKDAIKIAEMLPEGKRLILTDTMTAETIKISRNALSASKLIVLNELYDLYGGANWNDVQEGLLELEEIPSRHLNVVHKGGRGAGGKCLKKDLRAVATSSGNPLFVLINGRNNYYLEKYPKCK